MRIYIGSLAYGYKPEEFRAFLVSKGINLLNEISFPRNDNGLRPFVFIDVPDSEGEKNIKELHGEVFAGRPLKVSDAHPRQT